MTSTDHFYYDHYIAPEVKSLSSTYIHTHTHTQCKQHIHFQIKRETGEDFTVDDV